METNLTNQQQSVFARMSDSWEKTLQYNDDLSKRATLLVSMSSVVVGIVATAKFLPEHGDTFSVESILLGVVCLLSVVMYWHAINVWGTCLRAMPGSTNVNELYHQYIAVSENEAFNNSLIDLSYALETCLAENDRKSKLVDKVARVFQWQIGVLALAIAWSGVKSVVSQLIGLAFN